MTVRNKLTLALISGSLALTAGCQATLGTLGGEPTSGLQTVGKADGLLVLVGLAFTVTVPLDLLILWATPNDPFPITRALFRCL